jgi:hypothetical protein
MHKGSCLCGAIRFEVSSELRPPDACHCVQCRKESGHVFVSTDVPKAAFKLLASEKLAWFQSSEKARRGFCSMCGSSLFWEPLKHDFIGIAMGAFDTPTKTHIDKHIFTAEKGDDYEIADGVPQFPRTPHG